MLIGIPKPLQEQKNSQVHVHKASQWTSCANCWLRSHPRPTNPASLRVRPVICIFSNALLGFCSAVSGARLWDKFGNHEGERLQGSYPNIWEYQNRKVLPYRGQHKALSKPCSIPESLAWVEVVQWKWHRLREQEEQGLCPTSYEILGKHFSSQIISHKMRDLSLIIPTNALVTQKLTQQRPSIASKTSFHEVSPRTMQNILRATYRRVDILVAIFQEGRRNR